MLQISTKTKAILVSSGLLISFAMGRYSNSAPEIKETKKVEENSQKQVDEQSHTQTVIVYTKDPKGQPIVTETVTNDTNTKTKDIDKITEQDAKDVSPPKRNAWEVSGLFALPTPGTLPAYGVSVTKEVLGPITVGAFGLTNGTLGLSVGVTF